MAPSENEAKTLVGLDRLELSTLRLSGVRSNHLSYRPSGQALTRKAAGLTMHNQPHNDPMTKAADYEWKEKRRRRRPAFI